MIQSDVVSLDRLNHFEVFKGCLPQTLFGRFLSILYNMRRGKVIRGIQGIQQKNAYLEIHIVEQMQLTHYHRQTHTTILPMLPMCVCYACKERNTD